MIIALVYSIADTLSGAYSDRWAGAPGESESNILMQYMSSNDLIFVVLAVSLIIWSVLAFYLVRVDKKISSLEEQLSDK
ncbi:MAG: CcmD family protein [Balneolia bacterium]|nr:CcmD family protein [Balneolia bacterium]